MEEMAKALFPLFACVALGVRGKRQLLVLGALSGVGFFFTEAVLALIVAYQEGTVDAWTHELTGRVFFLGHQHAMYTGFTGLAIGFAATRRNWFERIGFVALGLACACGFHSTFNALAHVIDNGYSKEGWDFTWSLNRKLILVYLVMLAVSVYVREKAHWTEVLGKKRSSEA
jgi:RsiW-degrading membrane proteinase PrsW (M82 family)